MKPKIIKYIPYIIVGIPCCVCLTLAFMLALKYPALKYQDYILPVLGYYLSIVTIIICLVLYIVFLLKHQRKIRFHLFFIISACILFCMYFFFPRFLPKFSYGHVFHLVRKLDNVRNDMRYLSLILEDYYIDHGAYPPWDVGENGENWWASRHSSWALGSSLHVNHPPTFKLGILTTPVKYGGMPFDMFADTKGFSYCYYSDGKGYIMFSWGPDVDEHSPDEWDLATDVQKVFRSDIRQPSQELLTGRSSKLKCGAYTYDPSNGLLSPGDIWYVRMAGDKSGAFSLR